MKKYLFVVLLFALLFVPQTVIATDNRISYNVMPSLLLEQETQINTESNNKEIASDINEIDSQTKSMKTEAKEMTSNTILDIIAKVFLVVVISSIFVGALIKVNKISKMQVNSK